MMTIHEALQVLAAERSQRVVITTMAATGIWPKLSDTGLDFAYIPSAMGHGPGLALGLALAHPQRGVILVNGDGSMLMNLGALVTLANHPANVYLVILDNGLYEVTGGQPLVGAGRTDYALIARGAGIERVYTFTDLNQWQSGAREALSGPGPVVIWLKIEGRLGEKTPKPPRPMAEQLARLQAALAQPLV